MSNIVILVSRHGCIDASKTIQALRSKLLRLAKRWGCRWLVVFVCTFERGNRVAKIEAVSKGHSGRSMQNQHNRAGSSSSQIGKGRQSDWSLLRRRCWFVRWQPGRPRALGAARSSQPGRARAPRAARSSQPGRARALGAARSSQPGRPRAPRAARSSQPGRPRALRVARSSQPGRGSMPGTA